MSMMTMRRQVLAQLAALPLLARAKGAQKRYRIGFLSATSDGAFFPDMRDELRRLGYEEGRNAVFEIREIKGQPAKTPGFAAELVASRVDVIVADLPRSILAAKAATSAIPIVMLFGMVPEELGLIQSMARPGGNVTGTLIQGPEAAGRAIQVVREILPPKARIALLYEAEYPGLAAYVAQYESAALAGGLRPIRFPVRNDEDVEPAFARIAGEGAEALQVPPTGPVFRSLERILDFADGRRIAILSPSQMARRAGCAARVRARPAAVTPARRRHRGQDPEGGEPGTDPGRGAHEVRVVDQHEGREFTGAQGTVPGTPAGGSRLRIALSAASLRPGKAPDPPSSG